MKSKNLLDKILLIIISVQTVLMGALFIMQILRIYIGNSKIFTREICIKYILEISPIIIIWILLIVVNYIYFRKKNYTLQSKSKISNAVKYNNLMKICPEFTPEFENEYKILNIEEKKRKTNNIINIVIIVTCSVMGLCYLLNVNHFKTDGDLASQAVQMFVHLIPWCTISFISTLFVFLKNEMSYHRSIEIIRLVIKNNGKKEIEKNLICNNLRINIIRASIVSLAIILIIIGIFDGGAYDVLQKAINICTECIGLG